MKNKANQKNGKKKGLFSLLPLAAIAGGLYYLNRKKQQKEDGQKK